LILVIAVTISLRISRPADREFLFIVYASTRADELALVDWTEEQKAAFLWMQFEAQSRFYVENYPGAEFQLILLDGQPVGRLYIHRQQEEIRIMDIALLPEYRRRGIGTVLLNGILEEAKSKHVPVTIHVERFNPAMQLYERLGFHLKEDRGVYHLLEWSPVGLEVSIHAG
jgi:GNAT superfamily N-acetyltransferase